MSVFSRCCISFPLIFIATSIAAQSKADIEKLAVSPKKTIDLPIDYAVLLPTPDTEKWDDDYHSYDHFATAAVRKTQMGMSYEDKGVHVWWCVPSARPHAEMDTSMRITDPTQLIGTWRAMSSRTIKFQDSAMLDRNEILRNNTIVKQENGDDVFLQISDKQFRLYAKMEGKKDFKREASVRYALEGGRYLLLYKIAKGGAAVSQVGIDKEGRLVMHSAIVEERKLPGYYIVYQAIISQSVYERINEQP